MAGESKADGGSIRSAIRWGLVQEIRAWRGAVQLGDTSGAEGLRTFVVADSIGLLVVLAFGVVIYFVLRPRSTSQP